jgi:hypothetical protein
MSENHPKPAEDPVIEGPLVIQPMSTSGYLFYVMQGLGVALGLCLLWGLEAVRNRYFRLLDRMNVKARTRKSSPFPPGQARKHPIIAASR